VPRHVLTFLINQIPQPLEKRAIPLVVQAVHRGTVFHREAELTHCDKAGGIAGFVFLLVRAAALNDSKVIKSRNNVSLRPLGNCS
jgi:hypothetical protein